MGPQPATWDQSRQHVYTAASIRTEPLFRIASSDRLGDGDPPNYRNYGSNLEPSGSAHVQAALHFDKCRQLYIIRFAGYMVGFGDTSVCNITNPPRLPHCLFVPCWTDPCTRCTYGDKSPESAGIGAAFTSEWHLSVAFEN
jgi:hypothetical protein